MLILDISQHDLNYCIQKKGATLEYDVKPGDGMYLAPETAWGAVEPIGPEVMAECKREYI